MSTDAEPVTGSLFDERTMLSIRVPDGWTIDVVEPATLRFTPPGDRAAGATMTVQRGSWHKGNVDKLERLIADSAAELERRSQDYRLEREERFLSSSLSLTYVRWYQRRDEDGKLVSHLQALVGDESLYLVNASATEREAPTSLPEFEAILRSIRVIPEE
jgi:hypothetical protein